MTKFIQNFEFHRTSIRQGNVLSDARNPLIKSVDGKVVWEAMFTIDRDNEEIEELSFNYLGSCSENAGNIRILLYDFENSEWEELQTIPPLRCAREIVLEAGKWKRFISEHRDLRIRFYVSADSAFVFRIEGINLKIKAKSEKRIETALPEAVKADDTNSSLHCFSIKTPLKRIHTLSIILFNQDCVNARALLSLYNHRTEEFVPLRDVCLGFKEICCSLTDHLEIADCLSDEGKLLVRVTCCDEGFVGSIRILVEEADFESFTIAQVSDIHELIGSLNFRAIIEKLNNLHPDFTLITGDVTDHGTPQQYRQYLEDIKNFHHTYYTLPGNHDVRWWNSNGKNDFVERIGPLYQSFDYKGVHFVLLDTTVTFELEGKVNKAQLKWLREDLKTVPKDMPVIFFAHHPFRIMDDVTGRDELLRTAAGHNLIAFLSGHMHEYELHTENGIPVANITYVKENDKQEFATILFTSRTFYVFKHKACDDSKELWFTGKMKNARKTEFSVAKPTVLDNGNVEVKLTIIDAPDGVASVFARVDKYGEFTELKREKENEYRAVIDISKHKPSLPKGEHFIQFLVRDEADKIWTEYAAYSWKGSSIKTDWALETEDIVRSSPTYFDGCVYAGSYDNCLYCIDSENGSLRWKFQAQDSIISKPAAFSKDAEAAVIFGANDRNLYAVDAKTGEMKWAFKTEGSVISDPLVAGETVIFGSGDNHIYAVNAFTGKQIWKVRVDGLMRQRPALYKNIVFAIVRNTFMWYAINLEDGSLVWRGNADTNESFFVCGDVRPMVVDDKLWVIDGQNRRLAYLDINSGKLAWTSPIVHTNSMNFATDGKNIYFPTDHGRQIHAIDAATQRLIWSLDLRYDENDMQAFMIDSGLIYSDGILIHTAEKGRITLIDSFDGTVIDSYDAVGLPERVFWSCAEVVDKKIFISGLDGKIYCISYQVKTKQKSLKSCPFES